MTVKEAVKKFGLDAKEIQKRKKDDMIIGANTVNNRIVIPGDVKIIPSKKEIQAFLFQILKYKNNNSIVISRSLCPDEFRLQVVMDYLYLRGFIGEFEFTNDINELFNTVKLTDIGIQYIFGEKTVAEKNDFKFSLISVNPELKVGLLNS